jgi:hypothetical protein
MSPALQGVIVAVLVLAAAAYALWRIGPASLRRRFGRGGIAAGDSCSNCQASTTIPAPKHAKKE